MLYLKQYRLLQLTRAGDFPPLCQGL